MNPSTLWVERHRPKSLDEMVLSPDHRETFTNFLKQEVIPHLLLVGAVGSGKTTVARILLSNLDCAALELNASDERGIDTVRNRVKTFLMVQSLKRWKVVFLDESEQMTPDAQFCLRNMMERFSERSRFILTANYEEKVIEPIRSRCQTLHFISLDRKSVFKKVVAVLNLEQVEFETDDVLRVVDELYPDVRKILNTLQLHTSNGKLTYRPPVDVVAEVRGALLKKDLRKIRELVVTHRPDYTALYRGLFDSLPRMKVEARAVIGVLIGEYLYRDALVADREINFAAFALEAMKEV